MADTLQRCYQKCQAFFCEAVLFLFFVATISSLDCFSLCFCVALLLLLVIMKWMIMTLAWCDQNDKVEWVRKAGIYSLPRPPLSRYISSHRRFVCSKERPTGRTILRPLYCRQMLIYYICRGDKWYSLLQRTCVMSKMSSDCNVSCEERRSLFSRFLKFSKIRNEKQNNKSQNNRNENFNNSLEKWGKNGQFVFGWNWN